jgi:hypothetical protein
MFTTDLYTFLFNVCIWIDNIKIDIRGTSFVFILNSSPQPGQSGIFGKGNDVILHKNNKYVQTVLK